MQQGRSRRCPECGRCRCSPATVGETRTCGMKAISCMCGAMQLRYHYALCGIGNILRSAGAMDLPANGKILFNSCHGAPAPNPTALYPFPDKNTKIEKKTRFFSAPGNSFEVSAGDLADASPVVFQYGFSPRIIVHKLTASFCLVSELG